MLKLLFILLLCAPLAHAQIMDDTPPDDTIAEVVLPNAWLQAADWEFVHSIQQADTLRAAVFWSELGTAVTLSGPGPLGVRVLSFYPERLLPGVALQRTPVPVPCPTEAPPFVACRLFPHLDN